MKEELTSIGTLPGAYLLLEDQYSDGPASVQVLCANICENAAEKKLNYKAWLMTKAWIEPDC